MNTFGRGDFRVPRELPMVLQSGKPPAGIGRGFGRGAQVVTAEPARPGAMPSLVSRDTAAETSGSRNILPDPGVTGVTRNAESDAGFSGGARNEAPFPSASGVASNLPPPGFSAGVGRGCGPQGNEKVPGYVKFKDALANANQPLREIEEYDKLRASFIPGFHVPGQNFPLMPESMSKAVNRIEIPDDLIRQYRGGTKNPVSAIEEFLKKLKLDGVFKETPVEATGMSSFGMFGYTCIIEGKKFPQGIARKKKDAKTEAARNAFDSILRDGFSVLKVSEVLAPNTVGAEAVSGAEAGAGDVTFEVKQPMTFGSQNSPASMFNEFCAKRGIAATIVIPEKKTANGFECEIRIKNQLVARACATSKKDAKTRACDEALRILMGSETMPTNEMTHFDSMAALAKAKLVELQRRYGVNISDYSVLAAFIVMMFNGDKGRVVALATGSGCPKGLELRTDGKVVVDCHAEVLARRALVKWFVKQLTLAVDGLRQNRSTDDSIFTLNETGDKFRLKETVSIHMYISNAPCGDAAVFPMTKGTIITPEELDLMHSGEHQPTFELHSDHGCLRVKSEDGQMTAKTLGATVDCGASSEEEHAIDAVRFRTMSCSDKILKWNILGLQGSATSHLLEPVYLNSLSLGNNFDFGHITRAVCCRVLDTVRDYLPAGYDLRHPIVGRVSVYEPTPVQSSKIAINWCEADSDVEIISTVTGRTIQESPFRTGADPTASRLCKFGFGFRFRALAKLFRQNHLLNHPTYQALKDAAGDYSTAKSTFYDHLETSEYGSWMKRAADLDAFHIDS